MGVLDRLRAKRTSAQGSGKEEKTGVLDRLRAKSGGSSDTYESTVRQSSITELRDRYERAAGNDLTPAKKASGGISEGSEFDRGNITDLRENFSRFEQENPEAAETLKRLAEERAAREAEEKGMLPGTEYTIGDMQKDRLMELAMQTPGADSPYAKADTLLAQAMQANTSAQMNRKAASAPKTADTEYGIMAGAEIDPSLLPKKVDPVTASFQRDIDVSWDRRNLPDTLRSYGDSAKSALSRMSTTAVNMAASAEDLVLQATGAPEGHKGLTRQIADYYNRVDTMFAEQADRNVKAGYVTSLEDNLVKGIAQQIPTVVLGAMGGGMGTAGSSLQAANASRAEQAMQLLNEASQNPMFWSSFVQEYGQSYREAIESGLEPGEAASRAILSAVPTALIEVGGGAETMWADLMSGKGKTAAGILQSSAEEFGEEVVQDPIGGVVSMLHGDEGKWFADSFDPEEDAVFNLARMLESGGTAALTSALTGSAGAGVSYAGQKISGRRTAAEEEIPELRALAEQPETTTDAATEATKAATEARNEEEALRTNGQAAETVSASVEEFVAEEEKTAPAPRSVGLSGKKTNISSEQQMSEEAREFAAALGEHGEAAYLAAEETAGGREIVRSAWQQYYNAGKWGRTMEWADRIDPSARALLVGDLTAAQAFRAGQLDAEAELQAARQKQTAAVQRTAQRENRLVVGEGAENTAPEVRAALESVAKAFDARIELADLGDSRIRGAYDRKTGTIRLNANAGLQGALINVAKHEITHQLQDEAPEAYAAFKNYVASELYGQDGKRFEELVQEQIDAYHDMGEEISRSEAEDEVVANATEAFLQDEESIRRLCEKDKSLGQKILDKIKEVVAKIRRALTSGELEQEAAQMLSEDLEVLEKAEGLWLRAMEARDSNMEKASPVSEEAIRYAIQMDANGQPFVDIDTDILAGVPKKDWAKTVRDELKKRFPNGVQIGDHQVLINAQSRNEMTGSKSTQNLSQSERRDKFRSLGHADEILQASDGYALETPKHPRKDNITSFARGDVRIRVGQNDYDAEVVIGIKSGGDMLLYDIVNLSKTNIKASLFKQNSQNDVTVGRRALASTDIIAQSGEDVKSEEEIPDPVTEAVEEGQMGILPGAEMESGQLRYNLQTTGEDDMKRYRKMLSGILDEGELEELFRMFSEIRGIVEAHKDILDFEVDLETEKFRPVKPNSDPLYKVSVDFSTLCRKRLLTQTITERLQKQLKRPLSKEEQLEIRNRLVELRKELSQIDVACGLCYVESRRLLSAKQIEAFFADPEKELRKFFGSKDKDLRRRVNEEARRMIEAKGASSLRQLSKESKEDAAEIRAWKRAALAAYRSDDSDVQAELEYAIDLAKNHREVFLSAQSLHDLMDEHPMVYDAFTTYVRNATKSKAQETRVPWRAGDSRNISDALIRRMNAENGLRMQSWSDFEVVNTLDYMTAVMELAARGAKIQTYTKVPDFVRLMGKTGAMINLSLIAKGEGVDADGNLLFDGREGMGIEDAEKLRVEYPGTAGTIIVGISDEHILAALKDDRIDYVIPYHTSGMSKEMRARAGILHWTDYESSQSEKGKGKAPSFSEWAAPRKGDDLTDGAAFMKKASERYLKLCHERGLTPKFSQFLQKNGDGSYSLREDAENYWKLLIDRKMVDSVTGAYIEQQAVKPVFDEQAVKDILGRELVSEAAKQNAKAADIVVDEFLRGEIEVSDETIETVRQMEDSHLRYGIEEAMRGETEKTAPREESGVRYQLKTVPKIRTGMTDEERYHALKDVEFPLVEYHGDASLDEDADFLERTIKSKAASYILPLAKKFGVFKRYRSDAVEIEFDYAVRGFNESIHKQKERTNAFADFAKMYTIFDELVQSAVPIEAHGDKYKDTIREDKRLKQVFVLVSAFRDGDCIVPVQFEIKEFFDSHNSMRVSVTLKKIKETGVMGTVQQTQESNRAVPIPVSTYRLAQIFKDVKPDEIDFLKYIPDDFLSEEQLKGKAEGIRKDQKKVEHLRQGERYQLTPEARERGRLIRENERLKKANAHLREGFKLTKGVQVSGDEVEKLARKVLKKYSSKADAGALAEELKKVYRYLGNDAEPNWETVNEVLSAAAGKVLEESEELDRSLWDETAEMRSRIRETPVYVPEDQRGDFARADGYQAFKRSHSRMLKIVNDPTAMSVDQFYAELAEDYPYLLDGEAVSAYDQLQEIADFIEASKPRWQNPFGENLEEMTGELVGEMYDAFFDLPEVKTFADKKQAEIDTLRMKHRAAMQELKEAEKQKREELLGEVRERYERRIEEMKDSAKAREARLQYEKWWGVQAEKIAAREAREKARDRRYISEQRRKIERKVKVLSRMVISPTDSQSVPEGLRNAVKQLVESLDLTGAGGSETNVSQRWSALKAALSAAAPDSETSHGVIIDPELEERIGNLAAESVSLNNMNRTQAEELYKALAALEGACRGVHIEDAKGRKVAASEVSHGMVEEMSTMKEIPVSDKRGYDLHDPRRFFDKFGEGMRGVFDLLTAAQDKSIRLENEALEHTKKIFSGQKILKWKNAKAQEFTTEGGGKIKLTPAQVMELYVLSKREQGQKHIYTGGIRTDEARERVSVTPADVGNIVSSLSAEQKKVADQMAEFLSGGVSEWGNEVSLELYRYKKFTEKHYWPIRTDSDYTATQSYDQLPDAQLKTLGMTKATNPNASNAVIIGDAFDTYARHITQMIAYSAYVPVLEQVETIYKWQTSHDGNIRSVRASIRRVGGKKANAYMEQLLRDLNGAGRTGRSFGEKMMGFIKRASIAGNVRVWVQQPTAYLRAAAEVNPVYLLKGLIPAKGTSEEMKTYAPIARWKDWGYYDIGTGRELGELMTGGNLRDKALNATMAMAGVLDNATWGAIWKAVKAETAAKTNLEPDSTEFLMEAGQRFREVIDRTQVVDSVLHRPQIMRSSNAMTKMSTAFMGEPLKSLNMVMGSADRIRQAQGKEKRKAAGGFVRSCITFMATAMLNALVTAFVDAERDDDDDETYWQKWRQALLSWDGDTKQEQIRSILGSNIAENLNPLNLIPYVKDILSLAQGYDVERMDMQGISEVMDNLIRWVEWFSKGEAKYTAKYMIIETGSSIAKTFGIPVANIIREVTSLVNLGLTLMDDYGLDTTRLRYRYSRQQLDIQHSANKNTFISFMLEARMAGDTELATEIFNDLIDAGYTNEQIESAMESRAKKMLKQGFLEQLEKYNTALAKGDAAKVDAIADELLKEGYRPDEIIGAARNLRNSSEEEEEEFEHIEESFWDDYGEEDLVFGAAFAAEALVNGDRASVKTAEQEMLDDGYTQKEVDSRVKSALKERIMQSMGYEKISDMEEDGEVLDMSTEEYRILKKEYGYTQFSSSHAAKALMGDLNVSYQKVKQDMVGTKTDAGKTIDEEWVDKQTKSTLMSWYKKGRYERTATSKELAKYKAALAKFDVSSSDLEEAYREYAEKKDEEE